MAWWQLWNNNLVGKTLDGRYRITQELGSGGFGDTYLAVDTRSPNNFKRVIKHFKPKDHPDSYILQKLREKFEEEKKTLEHLGEKNNQIPRLLDNFTVGNQFFYVQEFIDGHTLNHEMTAPLSESQVRLLLIEILEVMAFVHENRIIHRDLKPANIMRRKDRKIVIIDFGAVKELRSITVKIQQPISTVSIYTKGYAPVEQLDGNPRFASDVYAIGMIGIQALTGIRPDLIPKDTNLEVDWHPPTFVTLDFISVLQKMVSYDFKKRYVSAKEALLALNSLPSLPTSSIWSQPPISEETVQIVTPLASPRIPTPVITSRQRSSKTDTSNETGVITADPQPPNPYKVTGGLLLLALVICGFYLWQNPKLLSSLRLPFIPTAPLNDPKITISDTKAAALYVQAQEKYNKKDYKGAMDDFTEVIRLVPDYTDAYVFRGTTKDILGDKQEAVSDYNEAIRLKPNYALSYFNRGNTKAKIGDNQGAIADFSKAIEINYNLGAVSLADVYLSRGGIKYVLGDNQGSLTDYSKAIELRSDFSLAYYGMGNTKANLGDKQEALSAYDKAIEINRNWGTISLADAYFNRGFTKFNLGNKQEALSDINKAIELKSDFALAYYYLGVVKYNSGNKQEALSAYDKAIEINRNWGNGTIGISEAYVSRGYTKNELGDRQGALSDYNKAIELKPDNGDALYNRGSLKSASGDNQGAVSDYNEVIRLRPNYAYPYYGLGGSYKALADKTKALENFRKAATMLKQQNDTEWYRKALNEIAQLEK